MPPRRPSVRHPIHRPAVVPQAAPAPIPTVEDQIAAAQTRLRAARGNGEGSRPQETPDATRDYDTEPARRRARGREPLTALDKVLENQEEILRRLGAAESLLSKVSGRVDHYLFGGPGEDEPSTDPPTPDLPEPDPTPPAPADDPAPGTAPANDPAPAQPDEGDTERETVPDPSEDDASA